MENSYCEDVMKQHVISVNGGKCIGCGLCQADCPVNDIFIEGKKAVIKAQNCIYCGHCVAICPKAAIAMTGFDEESKNFDQKTVLDPRLLMEAIRSRRSIRHFKNQPIDPEIIRQIIEAGRLTPTAKNAQDVSYIVLQNNKEQYEAMAIRFLKIIQRAVGFIRPSVKNIEINDSFLFKKAPTVILILSKNNINGALAASHMALMAEAHDLGVLYSGFFAFAANHSRALRKALSLKSHKVVATLVIGYSNVVYQRSPQREKAAVRYL